MENSLPSSSPNNLSPQEEEDDEESGWTQYLVDFSEENRERRKEEENYESEYCCSASLISDASSGPHQKKHQKNSSPTDHFHGNSRQNLLGEGTGCGLPTYYNNMMMNTSPRKLNFKKKRINQDIPYDDDLEDTASSPVNSPKIALGMKRMDLNSRKTDHENFDHSHLGKGSCDDYDNGDIAMGGEFDQIMIARKIEDCTDLKQKGLCLAPVSMFVNYAG